MDMEWGYNPNWRKLETPSSGDIVQLKETSGFCHLINVIVSSVTDHDITGVVEAVFDWQNKGQLNGGEILNVVGQEMKFPRRMIHNVIKKPARIK